MKTLHIEFFQNIGPDYLHRYRLFPAFTWKGTKRRYFPFNLFLHRFLRSDHDRGLHDHPWPSMSILLKGELWERYESEYGLGEMVRKVPRFRPVFRSAEHQHRIILKSKDAWTLFAVGFKRREWGFWPDGKFVPWRTYLPLDENETID